VTEAGGAKAPPAQPPHESAEAEQARSGEQRIATIGGVPVFVSATWYLVAVVITVLFQPVFESWVPELGSWSWVVAACFAVLLYAGVLVHELGHALTARAFGFTVDRITLDVFGGVTQYARSGRGPGAEILVAAAGPLLSLALGGLGLGIASALTPGTLVHLLTVQLGAANLLVGVFNLIPGLPLDGGQVLRGLIWAVSGSRQRATLLAVWAGRIVAVGLVALPVVWARLDGRDPDLVAVIWGAVIGAVVWRGAGQALRSERAHDKLGRLSVRALTRRAIPVLADVSVAEALRRLGEAGARALVVVDRQDKPLALVSEAAVVATPVERRPWVTVATVSRRIEPGLVIEADLDGRALVEAMRRTPAAEYLVVDDQQRVFGVLVTADVNQAFAGA
jgi:Zn-dependent protease/CBS domain-containing protein